MRISETINLVKNACEMVVSMTFCKCVFYSDDKVAMSKMKKGEAFTYLDMG